MADTIAALDIARLRLFLAVAEEGNLTRAATMLEMVQPVMSRHIGALERACGGVLFQRTGRGVILTPLGQMVLPRARALVADADQLAKDIRSAVASPVGEVHIGLLPSIGHTLTASLFQASRARYPDVRLRILEGSGAQLESWIARGVVDLAVLYRHGRLGKGSDEALGGADACLISAAGDALTSQRTVRFRQLDRLPLVLPSRPSSLRALLDQVSRRLGIAINPELEADSLTVQKQVVACKGIYAILSRHAVAEEIAAGCLQAAPIASPRLAQTVTLETTTHHALSFAVRRVAELLRQTALGRIRMDK